MRRKISHSTQFSGGVCYRLSKASRREDLQVEEPVACWDCASFDFHPTLPGMLSAPLVGHQVVQMGQPAQKHLLAPFGVMVTVQVVKTGITPPLATSGRFWGAEMERLHHARRLHAQQ